MAECVERLVAKRQCRAICDSDCALLAYAILHRPLERHSQSRDRNIGQDHVAPGPLREVQSGPSGASAYIEQPHAGAKRQPIGDFARFITRCPAGAAVIATENTALQISHCARATKLVVPRKTPPQGRTLRHW